MSIKVVRIPRPSSSVPQQQARTASNAYHLAMFAPLPRPVSTPVYRNIATLEDRRQPQYPCLCGMYDVHGRRSVDHPSIESSRWLVNARWVRYRSRITPFGH